MPEDPDEEDYEPSTGIIWTCLVGGLVIMAVGIALKEVLPGGWSWVADGVRWTGLFISAGLGGFGISQRLDRRK